MKPKLDSAIWASDLTKTFQGHVVAVSGLHLQVPEGAIYGLIGRNGAGKTTTLRLLMGLLRADTGETSVLGHDLWTAPAAIRARVGYVPQTMHLPAWMTVDELCRYLAHCHPCWDQALQSRLQERWGLTQRTTIGALSGGQQRLAALLATIPARPRILMLDEPAAGLDPIARRDLLRAIVECVAAGDGCTVLFSTHYIGDLERVADHVGIMDRGRMVTSSSLDHLLGSTKRVQVIFDEPFVPEDFAIPGTLRSEVRGSVVNAIVRLATQAQLDPVLALPGVRVQVFDVSLEELFIALFQSEPTDELSLCS